MLVNSTRLPENTQIPATGLPFKWIFKNIILYFSIRIRHCKTVFSDYGLTTILGYKFMNYYVIKLSFLIRVSTWKSLIQTQPIAWIIATETFCAIFPHTIKMDSKEKLNRASLEISLADTSICHVKDLE